MGCMSWGSIIICMAPPPGPITIPMGPKLPPWWGKFGKRGGPPLPPTPPPPVPGPRTRPEASKRVPLWNLPRPRPPTPPP